MVVRQSVLYATLAASLVVTAAADRPLAQEQQPPVFRGGIDLVRVFVTVTDSDGRLVTTLARNEFEVRDEGKPQPITLFDNTPQPIRLVVMLDVSGSMTGNLQLLRAASGQLFARLGKEDVARVGTFGRDVTLSEEFTRDERALREALPDVIEPDAPTPLWRGVDKAMDAFEKTAEPRPVVLVLSDGKDSGPPMSFKQRYVSQVEVIERARREGIMIYTVGMRSRSDQPRMPTTLGPAGLQAMLTEDLPDPGLARVAEETGGGYTEIRVGQNLGAAFARVADELHSQYLLGYALPKRDGKKHDIEVRVTPRGMKPRAKKSYVAP
jgi:Ca-activated chloride channel family protein